MKLLVCVIDDSEKLQPFLRALAERGLSGGTVMESQGMSSILSQTMAGHGLRSLFQGEIKYNNTIFSVVEDDELLQKTLAEIRAGALPGTGKGQRGIAFTCPVTSLVKFSVKKSRPAGHGQIEHALAEALRTPRRPSGLLEQFKRLFGGDAASPEVDRRRWLRIACDITVTARLAEESFELRLSDIGLAGITATGPSCEIDRVLSLEGPDAARSLPVKVKVVGCRPEEDEFRLGLVYEESPLETWVFGSLIELGFGEKFLRQRRQSLRIPTELQVSVSGWRGERLPATLLDVGVGGAAIEADAYPEKGSHLVLHLGSDGAIPELALGGEVVSVMPRGEGSQIGLVFANLPARENELLQNFISTLREP